MNATLNHYRKFQNTLIKKIFVAFILILSVKSFSQNSKVSVELNYPIPFEKNSDIKNYEGIIDGGVKYRFINAPFMDVGTSMNVGRFNGILNFERIGYRINIFTFQPRIFAEFNIEPLSNFHPTIGVGYAFLNLKTKDVRNSNPDTQNPINLNSNQDGINLNVGVAYDLNPKFFLQVTYDFIQTEFSTALDANFRFLKFGLGYRV